MGLPKQKIKWSKRIHLEKKRMKEQSDFMNSEKNTGDAVIDRGYAIYDEWLAKKLSSQKIVNSVIRAVCAVEQNRTNATCIEALSYLFALDMRIEERYKSILHCIFRYFSWRRETNALNRLKGILHISKGEDIRAAIEARLQRLRDGFDDQIANDGDSEAHGGKHNGNAEKEVTAKEKAEKIVKAEETKKVMEEKTEDVSEQTTTDEPIKESGEKLQNTEPSQDALEKVGQDEKRPVKEEHNSLDEEAGESKDKPKEAINYNDVVDVPPLPETTQDKKPSPKKTSFIDESLMDDLFKLKKDFIIQNFSENEKPKDKEAPKTENTVTQRLGEGKSTDKESVLYDNPVSRERIAIVQDVDQTVQEKGETMQETVRKNENAASVNQGKEGVRTPLQVHITENQVRQAIDNHISAESVEAYYNWQADLMREQLQIASEEFGIDAPVEIIGRPESTPKKQPRIAPNRK